MRMITVVKTVLGKYATFSGRAGRAEFWWYPVGFIPIVGTFILLYWFLQPSTPGDNQFG